MISEIFFFNSLGLVLLKVILTLIIEILKLEFLYLHYSFWNIFSDSFQVFLELLILLEKFVNLGFIILNFYMIVS